MAYLPNLPYENHHKEMWEQKAAWLIYKPLKDMYSTDYPAGLMALSLYGLSDQYTDSTGQIDYSKDAQCQSNFAGIQIADVISLGNNFFNNDLGELFCQ